MPHPPPPLRFTQQQLPGKVLLSANDGRGKKRKAKTRMIILLYMFTVLGRPRSLLCYNQVSHHQSRERLEGCLKKIRTHLDLLSIPRLWEKNVKTFRWDQRLQIHPPVFCCCCCCCCCCRYLKKNLNASRPSEYPSIRGKISKRSGGITIGCKYKASSWYLYGFPDGSNIGSTV